MLGSWRLIVILIGQLSPETLASILHSMAKSGIGLCDNARISNKFKGRALVLPSERTMGSKAEGQTRPERWLILSKSLPEWADLVYGHVKNTGQLGSIMTVYELFYSDEVNGSEFVNIPESLWRRIIRTLEASGKAKLFDSEESGSNTMELGIKFF